MTLFKDQYFQYNADSSIRLTKFEKNQLCLLISKYQEDSNDIFICVGLLVGLQYSLGLDEPSVLNFDLSLGIILGVHVVPVEKMPLELKENRVLKEGQRSEELNELHLLIMPRLKRSANYICQKYQIKKLSELVDQNVFTKKDIARFYDHLNDKGCVRPIRLKVPNALKVEISVLYEDPLLSYLVSNKENREAPALRNYQKKTFGDIDKKWVFTQRSLFLLKQAELVHQKGDIYKSRIGTYISDKELKKVISCWKSNVPKNSGKTVDELVHFHNQFTLYTLSLVAWATGHRPNNDLLCDTKKWSKELRLILINDKNLPGVKLNRLVGICELTAQQLCEYEKHLAGFATTYHTRMDRLENRFVELEEKKPKGKQRKYIRDDTPGCYAQKISKNIEVGNARYFFLIERKQSKQSNGYKNEARPPRLRSEQITTKHLEKFQTCNGTIKVPLNYSRRRYATIFSETDDLGCKHARLFLGHSFEEFITKNSSLSLLSSLQKNANVIQRDMLNLGFSLINGVRQSQGMGSLPKQGREIKPGFISRRRLAHAVRNGELDKKKEQIELLCEEISEFQINLLEGAINESEKLSEFSERASRLGSPTHPSWKRLKGIENIEYEPTSFLGKIFKSWFPPAVSYQLDSDLIEKLVSYDQASNSLIEVINKETYEEDDPYQILALAFLSAAFIGGLTCRSSLESIFDLDQYRVFNTNDIVHVDFYKIKITRKGKKITSKEPVFFNRWLPDPVTAALLERVSRFKKFRNNKDKVKEKLSELCEHLQTPRTKIASIVSVRSVIVLPSYLGHIAKSENSSVPLSLDCFIRLVSNKRNIKTVQQIPKYSSVEPKLDELKNLESEIRDRFNSVKTKNKGKILSRQLSKVLYEYIDDAIDLPSSYRMFLEWAAFLCLKGSQGFGTKGQTHLARSTLTMYITGTLSVLIRHLQFEDLTDLTEDQFDKFYQSVVDSKKTPKTKDSLSRNLVRFHIFIMHHYGVPESSWVNSRKSVVDGYSALDGQIVNKTEYQLAIQEVSKIDEPLMVRRQSIFIMVMMWNYGVRIGEAIRLCPRDIQLSDAKNSFDLVVRKTVHGDTKTRAGVRVVKCRAPLSDFEFKIVRSLKYQVMPEAHFESNVSLCRASWASRTNIGQGVFSKIIAHALKSVSGDIALRPHHFRHGFATRALMPIFESNDSNYRAFLFKSLQGMDIQNVENKSKGIWLPGRISSALGHKYSATTLKFYAHIREGIFNQSADALSKIQDKSIAKILNIKSSQYAQRRRRIDPVSGHKNHNAVYHYLREGALPSLVDSSYETYPPFKKCSINDFTQKPSLIRIVEFVLGEVICASDKSIAGNSNHGIPDDIALHIRASMVVCSKDSSLSEFNLLAKQGRLKLPELSSIERVHRWFSKSQSLINKLFSDPKKKNIIKICLRTILTAAQNHAPAIVISDHEELNQILFLLNALDIEYGGSILLRSTKKEVAEKFSGIKDKNAANKYAVSDSLKEGGCEMVINFSDEILKMRTFLQIIYVLMVILLSDA